MDKEKEYLSEEQANWLKQFSSALSYGILGAYTPSLLNQNLKKLNNNPKTPDYDKLIDAITDAINKSDDLHAYEEWMEYADITFKRVMEYYANILSFDLSYTCINIKSKEDYKTPKYKKDRRAVEKFLSNFDYKREFSKVMRQLMRTEVGYYWLRNNEDTMNPTYTLQLMPQNKCKITGAWEKGLLYDFNMDYFLQVGVDIDGYDPVFKEMARDMYEEHYYENYVPTNPFPQRTGAFAYWTQTSPIYYYNGLPSGAWAFKLDDSTFNEVPLLSSLMSDAIMNIPTKKLQYDKDAMSAYAYIIGEIGMLKSNEPNATQFDPVRLGTLLNIVKNAVGNKIAVGAMPANEIKWYQYNDDNTTMAQEQVKSVVGSGASASRILYATDKMSQEEVRNAIIADYNLIKKVYTQFNSFLNFYANQMTKHYKFQFCFDGSNFPFEREWRKDGIMRLAENGIVLNETAFASAYGYDPVMFSHMLEETSADGSWMRNLSSLQSIYTQSATASASINAQNKGVSNGNVTQKGGNRSNYNTEGTTYIHTGRPGRPRKAVPDTEKVDMENEDDYDEEYEE